MQIPAKYKGIVYIMLSALCFAFMNAFVRLSGDLPSVQKSFFRNLVAFIFAFLMLRKNSGGFSIHKGCLKYLILRAAFGTMGILCNFYAVDHLVLADASMLNKMSPFFAILFSYFLLKEKLNPAQGTAVVIAFIGSLFIIKPTFTNMELVPSLIGLLGGLCAGAAYTFVRKLGQLGEKGAFVVFFFSGFSCLVTLPFLLFDYTPMSVVQVLFLLAAGLSAAGGQFSITAAYFYAPAREISVFDYSQIIFATILGYFLFQQIPDGWSFIGYILICSMAVWMFLRNRKQSA